MTPQPFTSTSQCHQDTFARRLIGPAGTFLDLGAGHPVERSNTCGLEHSGWTGWLVERDPVAVEMLRAARTSPVHALDLTQPNPEFWLTVSRALNNHGIVNYLSLDVDENSLNALCAIPRILLRFDVITIEHDSYRFGPEPRDAMRKLLTQRGYTLVCADVLGDPTTATSAYPFEDWWVDASRVTGWQRYVNEGMHGIDFECLYPEAAV